MTLTPGKYYRTRDGGKAHVLAADEHFAVGNCDGLVAVWHLDGSPHFATNKMAIISEWTDRPVVEWSKMPAWANWVAMNASGAWLAYPEKPSIGLEHWSGRLPCYIPAAYATAFTGRWQDSLTGREETK